MLIGRPAVCLLVIQSLLFPSIVFPFRYWYDFCLYSICVDIWCACVLCVYDISWHKTKCKLNGQCIKRQTFNRQPCNQTPTSAMWFLKYQTHMYTEHVVFQTGRGCYRLVEGSMLKLNSWFDVMIMDCGAAEELYFTSSINTMDLQWAENISFIDFSAMSSKQIIAQTTSIYSEVFWGGLGEFTVFR